MEKFVNNSILEKVNDIISMIQNVDEYRDYMLLYEKMRKNQKINDLIQRVKTLQKEIVKKESLQQSTADLEKSYQLLMDQLNRIPLYIEFVEKQEELNNVYQNLKREIDRYFYQLFN